MGATTSNTKHGDVKIDILRNLLEHGSMDVYELADKVFPDDPPSKRLSNVRWIRELLRNMTNTKVRANGDVFLPTVGTTMVTVPAPDDLVRVTDEVQEIIQVDDNTQVVVHQEDEGESSSGEPAQEQDG